MVKSQSQSQTPKHRNFVSYSKYLRIHFEKCVWCDSYESDLSRKYDD